MRKDSIKTKVMIVILTVLILSLGISSVSFLLLSSQGTAETVEVLLTETAKTAALGIEKDFASTSNTIKEIGAVTALSDPNVSPAEKLRILGTKKEAYGFDMLFMANAEGKLFDGTDLSSQDFYKQAMQGKTAIEAPTVNADSGAIEMAVSAPVWQDGNYGGTPAGAIFGVFPGDYISKMIANIEVGETGYAYVIDKNGTTIADFDQSLVAKENSIQESKTNPDLLEMAALEQRALNGETVFGEVKYDGQDQYLITTPINGTDGWVLGLFVEKNEFLAANYRAMKVSLLIALIALLLGSAVVIRLAHQLLEPIVEMEHAIEQMSKGNFDVSITRVSKDEIGQMAQNMREMVTFTKEVIDDTVRGLEEMSNGNFDIAPQAEYVGIYQKIEVAMHKIVDSLNASLSQIGKSSELVNLGAEQVSASAQILAQGSTEQAATVEELSASVQDVAMKIKENAVYTQQANEISQAVGDQLQESNDQMKQMMGAMDQISVKSAEIGKIIKTIEDIAFQTNILALNAAVEAARAGTAGKGFAVVADEVRNLAGKSAEAAKDTTKLIEDTVKAVENGTLISDETSKKLNVVLADAERVVQAVTEIAQASVQQAAAIEEITLGLDQISSVVQSNSATSEESAATSEHLSQQASILQGEIAQFNVKKTV